MKAQTMHRYELEHLADKNAFSILQFAHYEPIEGEKDSYKLLIDGTSNEEVLKALLNRLKEQNKLGPNPETEEAIGHLRSAGKSLSAYYKRMKKEKEEALKQLENGSENISEQGDNN